MVTTAYAESANSYHSLGRLSPQWSSRKTFRIVAAEVLQLQTVWPSSGVRAPKVYMLSNAVHLWNANANFLKIV